MNLEYNISSLILMMTIVSFLGFLVENVWLAFTKGYMDNRNMALPFLLGYGIAIIGLFILLGTPQNSHLFDSLIFLNTPLKRLIFYFLCAFLFVCVGEILLGTLVEKIYHMVWWNYSRFTLHVTKYTTVPTSSGFAFIITFFMDKCFNPIMDLISRIDCNTSKNISLIFLGLMVFDFLVSAIKVYKNKAPRQLWRIDLKIHREKEESIT